MDRELTVREYELLTIFSPEIADDGMGHAIELLGQQIGNRGG